LMRRRRSLIGSVMRLCECCFKQNYASRIFWRFSCRRMHTQT
jgi:hypothetical protein